MVNIIICAIHLKSVIESSLYHNPVSTKDMFDMLKSLAWLRSPIILLLETKQKWQIIEKGLWSGKYLKPWIMENLPCIQLGVKGNFSLLKI